MSVVGSAALLDLGDNGGDDKSGGEVVRATSSVDEAAKPAVGKLRRFANTIDDDVAELVDDIDVLRIVRALAPRDVAGLQTHKIKFEICIDELKSL